MDSAGDHSDEPDGIARVQAQVPSACCSVVVITALTLPARRWIPVRPTSRRWPPFHRSPPSTWHGSPVLGRQSPARTGVAIRPWGAHPSPAERIGRHEAALRGRPLAPGPARTALRPRGCHLLDGRTRRRNVPWRTTSWSWFRSEGRSVNRMPPLYHERIYLETGTRSSPALTSPACVSRRHPHLAL
jgi:hypothetical protein